MCFIKHIFKDWVVKLCDECVIFWVKLWNMGAQMQWTCARNSNEWVQTIWFLPSRREFLETISWFFANCVNQPTILVTLSSVLGVSSCNHCDDPTIITQECNACPKTTMVTQITPMKTQQLVFYNFLQVFCKMCAAWWSLSDQKNTIRKNKKCLTDHIQNSRVLIWAPNSSHFTKNLQKLTKN